MARILVGTLRSIENEFESCCEALRQQSLQTFEHFVISGLPKLEAHDALFHAFMARSHEFDMFLKLDADMVLTRPTMLAELSACFSEDKGLQLLTVGVHDFFSARLVNGLHMFRSDVRWNPRGDVLFTDVNEVDKFRTRLDFDVLAPAALHCPNPSPFQAFHYGLHRGLKIRAALSEGRSTYVQIHLANVDALWANFKRVGDRRLGLAALAVELALRGDFDHDDISYTNPRAESIFSVRFAHLSQRSLYVNTVRLKTMNRIRNPRLVLARIAGNARQLVRMSLLGADALGMQLRRRSPE
nr:hypothetical protein [Nitrosomonas nitrosa]